MPLRVRLNRMTMTGDYYLVVAVLLVIAALFLGILIKKKENISCPVHSLAIGHTAIRTAIKRRERRCQVHLLHKRYQSRLRILCLFQGDWIILSGYVDRYSDSGRSGQSYR